MSRLVVTNIETQNIKFDSDTTAFTIGSDGVVTGNNASAMIKLFEGSFGSSVGGGSVTHYDIDSTYINSTYDAYDIIGYFRPSGDNRYLYMKLLTGGSAISDENYIRHYDYGTSGHLGVTNTVINFLDSPSSTSSVSYQLYMKKVSGDSTAILSGSITLMEIAQ